MNAMRHGLLAKCVVLENEKAENFEILLGQFLERFSPSDGVEVGMIEEMVAALWRQRRAWAMETRLLDDAVNATEPNVDARGRLAAAITALAARPELNLIHRYETRLHRMFQRALHNLLLLRSLDAPPPDSAAPSAAVPNEPSPNSGHPVAPLSEPAPSAPGPGPRPPAAPAGPPRLCSSTAHQDFLMLSGAQFPRLRETGQVALRL